MSYLLVMLLLRTRAHYHTIKHTLVTYLVENIYLASSTKYQPVWPRWPNKINHYEEGKIVNNFQTIMKMNWVPFWNLKVKTSTWKPSCYAFLVFPGKKLGRNTLLPSNNEVENDCEQATNRKIEWYTGLYTNMREGAEDSFEWKDGGHHAPPYC